MASASAVRHEKGWTDARSNSSNHRGRRLVVRDKPLIRPSTRSMVTRIWQPTTAHSLTAIGRSRSLVAVSSLAPKFLRVG